MFKTIKFKQYNCLLWNTLKKNKSLTINFNNFLRNQIAPHFLPFYETSISLWSFILYQGDIVNPSIGFVKYAKYCLDPTKMMHVTKIQEEFWSPKKRRFLRNETISQPVSLHFMACRLYRSRGLLKLAVKGRELR